MHYKSKVNCDEISSQIENKDIKDIIDNKENRRNIAVPEEVPRRWGDKSIEILNIRFLNDELIESNDFVYGSSVTIEIIFKANEDVVDPVVGIGIFLEDGTRCYGNNTSLDGINFGTLRKDHKAKVSFYIERLDLVNGTYVFNFAVHALDGYAYDYLNKMFRIAVYSSQYDIGIFKPLHKWIIT